MPSLTREFILHSQGEDGYVEVLQSDTLADVRRLILDDFDPEQLPDGDDNGKSEFAFRVNGIRISAKQEARKNAFGLLESKVRVELVPKKRKASECSLLANEEEGMSRSVKRAKIAGAVTPFEPSAMEKLEPAADDGEKKEESGEDDSSTIATDSSEVGSSSGSVLAPVQLDTKFATSGSDDAADVAASGADAADDDYDSEATISLDKDDANLCQEKAEVQAEGDEKEAESTKELERIANSTKGMEKELEEISAIEEKIDAITQDPLKDHSSTGKKPEPEDEILEGKTSNGEKEPADEKSGEIDASLKEKPVDDALEDAGIDFSSSGKDDSFGTEDDIVQEVEEEVANDPHKESDVAKEKSRQVLTQLSTILKENEDFCSDTRRKEWLEDVQNLTEKSSPQTVFGVLGNTGVGKSSLLNGLLDEAAVLPTSGSRGCTAAVVELLYNADLMKEVEGNGEDPAADPATVPVYRGEVEFITLEDWRKELKTLVEECSTQEKTIYALSPQEDSMPDAAQAWQKIDQVYGRGSMARYCRARTDFVYQQLANDLRVKKLLTSTTPGQAHNSIVVRVGEAVPGSDDAKELLKGHGQMKSRMKGKKKKWAQEFRKQINSYVYRKGNGDQPQTWPLIRKVQLNGPWSVLSTGAVLVDLPGVRDSNAARAKVAENYLQNCNQIAIVAPIKRAVDDGTAKELLGEQFKRRLLMDGQYGNVFFICTQTDDIEATETMRDHDDVAQEMPGRWEKMTELADGISDFETQLHPLLQQEEELEGQVADAKQELKDSLEDLKEAEKENDDEDYGEEESDPQLLEKLRAVIEDNRVPFIKAKQDLANWKEANSATIEIIQAKCDRLQKKLKALCSTVRNEYSKQCLQADFKSGLKELYRKDDDDDRANDSNGTQTALPEEFNMDVFCISANDYLKLMKIKPSRDGPPSTFSNPSDTQIPQLRSFVHQTTARFCQSSVKTFVENTNDLLDQMKLLAADVDDVPTGRSAFRMKSLFEAAIRDLTNQIEPIASDFQKVIDQKIQCSLASSLRKGAQKGSKKAMKTVHSWGSKSRRTKSERHDDKNGLYYSTYNAVARRDGVYTSKSAGAIDFNQELCDPMEKEFSTEWQSVLDSTTRRLLNDAEKTILQLCTAAGQAFAQSLRSNGIDATRLTSMLNTANRSAISGLRTSFQQMAQLTTNAQRELSRELLPAVQEKMKSSYQAVQTVPGGCGTFGRMKGAMTSGSERAVHGMFDSATEKLMSGILMLVKRLKTMIGSTSEVISKVFDNVFSICWDDQQSEALVNPEMQKAIRECRDKLLPELNELVVIQGDACQHLGIERVEMELDVVGVESWEQTMARKKEEAKRNGNMFDLCDPDTEMNIQPEKGVKVKAEKKAAAGSVKTSAPSKVDIIDLCDSDDDRDEWKMPAASKPVQLVKDEAFV